MENNNLENVYDVVKTEQTQNNDINVEQNNNITKPVSTLPTKSQQDGGLIRLFIIAIVFGLVFSFVFTCSNSLLSKLIDNTNKTTIQATEIVQAPEGDVVSTSISSVAQTTMPSVVSITNLNVQEVNSFFYGKQQYESKNVGSGIIIGKNETELLIVTNHHVIEGNTSLTVTFVDDTSIVANVKGSDASIDIAIISVKIADITDETFSKIKIATLGDSDKIIVGEPTIAIGNALGYGQSVTSGIVSATKRRLDGFDVNLIQTDAAINPGNSGGALLNIRGEVIGINTVKVNADAVEGMGYAIAISDVQDIIDNILNKETREKVAEDERGKLGISCVDVDEMAMTYYNMPKGAYISEVNKNSAAEKAGLNKGTIITKFDGTSITGSSSLVDLLSYYKAGETVTMLVSIPKQDGTYESKEVQVILEKNQND